MKLLGDAPASFPELVALMASVDDWEGLSKGERILLVEITDHVLGAPEESVDGGLRQVTRTGRSNGVTADLMSWLHHLVRSTVPPLVDDGRCVVPLDELRGAVTAVENEGATGAVVLDSLRDQLAMRLVLLLLASPVPFIRCRQCSRVIVRGPKLNREYCSILCRNRWHEARRPPRHQEVMEVKTKRRVVLKPKAEVKE